MKKNTYTPMMQHYLQLKEENPESILFYRLGDFYEMFFEDAKIASSELDLVLTGRSAGVEEKVPMCGIPFHAANSYISRLVKKGYKVAICEQLSDPATSKGLVKRDIIKIVTPGTIMDETLDAKSTNYMASISINAWEIAIIYCDITTGELKYQTIEHTLVALQKSLLEQEVCEIICPLSLDKRWQQALQERGTFTLSFQKKSSAVEGDEKYLDPNASDLVKEAFVQMMAYLRQTQKQNMDQLMPMESMDQDAILMMDYETKSHLELTKSQSTSAKAVSLWEFMDRCQSAMGSRLLKRWIERPLLDVRKIHVRQQAIATFKENFMLREQCKEHLLYIYDMERLASRIAYGSASPRDILQLVSTLEHAKPLFDLISQVPVLSSLAKAPTCQGLYHEIKDAIVENPPLTLKEGNVFQTGYNEHLDELRILAKKGKDFILDLEAKERERTGVKSLKIGYNRVFGYYIEVRNGNLSAIKDEFGYHAKQTLANATRFITEELKEKEEQILHAQEEKVKVEQELFKALLERIKDELFDLHSCAKALACLDVYVGLGTLASDKGYVCPEFHGESTIDIQEGKHPILDDRMQYVSNDWIMSEKESIALITGPNMGGKSTFMRQNALLVIMAQMGSFIPCKKASLPIFDRIFTRIGASDDILTGKSTFMVEMMEANLALRYATKHSLILFDEIGRGTATYDGMAIAQAMLEYIEQAIHSKTLFSTHYHELTNLEQSHEGIVNKHVDVREQDDHIEFRYRIVDGKADKSYGINVARLAHLPGVVLDRAKQILSELEQNPTQNEYQPSLFVMEQNQPEKNQLVKRLKDLDIDSMSPREALDCLYDLKKLSDDID